MASTLRAPSMAQATRSAVARPARSVRVVCQAQKQEINVKQVVGAAALATAMSLGCVDAAKADISGLTPCSKSKAFAKLEKKELKKLAQRKKQYEAGSAPALALDATAERTKARFATYAKANLLCGADGLPHLISEPGLALKYNHAGEVFIPTFGFLYIAGWIGNVGRTYLNMIRKDKPYEKEIIIDVPLAIKLALQGAGWPLTVVQELQAGTLTEKQENITVSPR